MPSLCRTSRFRRSPASFRSPSLIMSSTPFTEVGCMDLRDTFLLILCSCVQVITGLTRRHRKLNKSPDGNAPFLHHRSSIAFQHPSPLPLLQLAPRNQSPTTQNHPLGRPHQGDMYRDGSLRLSVCEDDNTEMFLPCSNAAFWIHGSGLQG